MSFDDSKKTTKAMAGVSRDEARGGDGQEAVVATSAQGKKRRRAAARMSCSSLGPKVLS